MLKRFRFGNVDFAYSQVFCGLQVNQSLSHEVATLSLKSYVHKIKQACESGKVTKAEPDRAA